MQKFLSAVLATAAILFSSGCVSSVYQGKSFPATDSVAIFDSPGKIPRGYTVIGSGRASGEFSGTSNDELRQKLQKLGMQHGANAMVIAGVRIVPDGHVVNDAEYNFIEASDDPDQTATEIAMQETINSDPNAGSTRYMRIMYAQFLRKKP